MTALTRTVSMVCPRYLYARALSTGMEPAEFERRTGVAAGDLQRQDG